MKYVSCQYINHGLCFQDSRIVYCTVGNQSMEKNYSVLKENYNGEKIDWDSLFLRINNDKKNLKRGIIPKSCMGCYMLQERDWDNEVKSKKFKYLLLSNWSACNSACRYCWRDGQDFLIDDIDNNSIINENDTYNIVPIIEDLIDKNYLDKEVQVDIAGGEPTMYYKFNEALYLLVNAGVKHITIFSNAIIYSEQIEYAIQKGAADILVSIDAGTAEMHKKLKRIVAFDRIWNNVDKYCSVLNPENKNKVKVKYIIVIGYNDSREEIYKWILRSIKANVSELILQADDCIYMKKNPKKESLEKVIELTEYFLEVVKFFNYRYILYSNVLNAYTMLNHSIPQYYG